MIESGVDYNLLIQVPTIDISERVLFTTALYYSCGKDWKSFFNHTKEVAICES